MHCFVLTLAFRCLHSILAFDLELGSYPWGEANPANISHALNVERQLAACSLSCKYAQDIFNRIRLGRGFLTEGKTSVCARRGQ